MAIASSLFCAPTEITDEELAEIAVIVSLRRKFEMSVYKDKCMKRRVSIRIRATHCKDAAEYCCLLRQNEQELELLQKALTIHVSQFFRNPSMYQTLAGQVLPGLFNAAAARSAEELHLLCLGCAGGEEPYSLAILLKEHFEKELKRFRVVITGVDIDESTLAAARRGEYGDDRLKEVSPGLRKRYFQSSEGRLRLVPEIREMVTFVRGDITAEIASRHVDLVLCRNTLIYFTRPDQEQILTSVAARLPSGGILVLGKSETLVGEARRYFAPVCLTERIYRRI